MGLAGTSFAAAPQILQDIKDRAFRDAHQNNLFIGLGYGHDGSFAMMGGTEASGTWVGPALQSFTNPTTTPLSDNWLTASNWSGNSVPNGATDAATFNDNGDLFGYRAILNGNITLQTLNFNNEAGVDIVSDGATNRVITTGTGGLVINDNVLTFQLNPLEVRFFTTGDAIDANITGSSVTKNGAGDRWLVRSGNTYTGGTNINAGRVMLVGGPYVTNTGRPNADALNDSHLGNGGAVNLNGGKLYIREDTDGGIQLTVTSHPIVVGPNGGEIQFDGTASPIWQQPISGTGTLGLGDAGDFLLEADSSGFTGTLVVDDYNFMGFQGDSGAMPNAAAFENFGRIDIANTFTGSIPNRMADNAPVRMYGAEIQMQGSALTSATEDIGQLVLKSGTNVVSVVTSGIDATLQSNGITREPGTTLLIRGQDLGDAGGAFGRILLDSAPALTNGIVPYAYGVSRDASSANTSNGLASPGLNDGARPVTYDARGLRPLDNAEMVAGGHELKNTSSPASATVDSLTLTGDAGGNPITVSGSTTIRSGLLISNYVSGQGSATVGTGNTVSANLNFNGSEAVIISIADTDFTPLTGPYTGQKPLTLSGVLSNANGLTTGGFGDILITGTNTYTGTTTIGQGRVLLNSSVASGVAGPLGNSTSAIVMMGGTYTPEFTTTLETRLMNNTAGSLTIGRDIQVIGENASAKAAVIGGVGSTSVTNLTGNIAIGGPATPYHDITLTLDGGEINVSGVVSGPGMLSVDGLANAGTVVVGNLIVNKGTVVNLSGNNTYSGGTTLGLFSWAGTASAQRVKVGNSNAFGTGPVYLAGRAILEATTAGLNIPNDIFALQGLWVDGTTPITLSGDVDLNVNAGRQDWNVASTTLTITGDVKAGGIFKFGAGTMVLAGNNSLMNGIVSVGNPGSATTNISRGGTVVASGANALGAGGLVNNNTQILSGSTLILDNVASSDNVLISGATGGGATVSFGASGFIARTGANTVQDVTVTRFTTLDTGGGSLTAAAGTVQVDAGASLTARDVLDVTGPVTPAAPPVPALRGNGTASLTKTGAGTFAINRLRNSNIVNDGSVALISYSPVWNTVNVQGGTLKLTAGAGANTASKVNKISNLNISAGASLDMTNNAMVVDYTGTSPRAALEDLLETGRAGGAWNGPGINSATAAAGPVGKFAIGIAEQSDTSFGGTFFGVPIDADSVLFRYTVSGDANIDGIANITDFAFLAANFNQPGRWATGDFNYDGLVNINDFSLLAANFNQTVPGDLPRGASVPEPAALSLIGLGVAGLAARRRRA